MPAPDYTARFLSLALILAVNGFFAASEVALLTARDSKLRQRAGEGVAGAKIALALLAHPEKLLSVTQIGVTLASLGLGWAGQDTLYSLLIGAYHAQLPPAAASAVRAGIFVLAFVVMTYCHVVIGEVVPKNLAIDKADRLAIIVAPALMLFYRITSVFVSVVEHSARLLTRLLGGSAAAHAGGHSSEELKLIVSSSRFAGNLPKQQEDMIHRVLDLDEVSVREIMRPRREIVSVASTATLDEVLRIMVESQHSRLPVWEDRPEQIIGAVFFKDLLRIWHDRRIGLRTGRAAPIFHLRQIMRKPLIVPETKPLVQTLEEFRSGHSHLALVVDEFGTVTGLLTVEDVLEQIVGDIEDEFDEPLTPPQSEADHIAVDGALSIRDLQSDYGLELPANAGFETIAGYILFRLGHIPEAGEFVDFEGHRFTVAEMERNRISKVRIEKMESMESGTPPESTESEGEPQIARH